MKRSKIRLTKKGKLTILMALIVIILIIITVKVIKHINRDLFKLVEQNNLYDLKINYDKSNIKELDDAVKKYIANERDEFIKEIKSYKKDGVKYEFVLETQSQVYKNIHFTHSYVYKYVGGAHYIRKDESFIYDSVHNKFLSINDFLKSDEAFNDLALIVKHKVNKYIIDNEIDIDEESVNEGTKPTKDNYKLFYLNNDGMTILFAPYQLVPWSSGVITVDIPWTNLSDIIKDEYQNEVKKEEKKEKITREERKVDEFKNSKVVAFTFDDGPNNRTTNMLLDGLDKYNAKVTFFVLGSRISYNKDVLLKAYQSGNEIGSHSYSHRNLIKLNDDEIIKEINDTNNVIKDVIGVSPVLLRPPYGSINSHVKSLSTMHIICWNVDSLDWKLKDRIKIKDEIVKNAKDGAIILVHDIYEESVMGALLAMEELYKEGYSFVTVSELAKIKGYTLDYDTTYYNFYKEA